MPGGPSAGVRVRLSPVVQWLLHVGAAGQLWVRSVALGCVTCVTLRLHTPPPSAYLCIQGPTPCMQRRAGLVVV